MLLIALGVLNLHPWQLEKYSGEQLAYKLYGWQLKENRRELAVYNSARMQMQTVINMSGRSLRKNKQVTLREVLHIPQIDGEKKPQFDVAKFHAIAKLKEKSQRNE